MAEIRENTNSYTSLLGKTAGRKTAWNSSAWIEV
jgi:hypothetical protein